MKPRVLFVHASAALYGSDKVLLNLVRGFASGGEWQPLVLLPEDGPLRAALADSGVEVHVVPLAKISRAMFGRTDPLALWRELRRAGRAIDSAVAGRAVHLVYSNTVAVLGGAWWARRQRCPHLWHVHEIILNPALVRWGLPRVVQALSKRVISNSNQTQGWLLQQAPRLAGRASVVHNGIAPMAIATPEQVADFRAAVGAGPDELVVTLAGRLSHWKGQGLLLEAASLLRQEGRARQLRFAIVGDTVPGHEAIRLDLLDQVRRLGLSDRVRLLPFTTAIHTVWRGTDVAVVPSTQPEPFGLVAIEAMACGVPVVAAGHGGLLDIIEPERSGLLFEPRSVGALADALARLADSADLRARLGAAGAARQATHFTVQAQVAQTLALCREMLP